jgi:KDO2-lipid IV(A) lauroyltransferase
MAKPRSARADYVVYLLVRILVCILQALTLSTGRALATGLAWLANYLDRRHRETARDNLRQAFPGKYSEAELDRLARGVFRHFATMLIEIIHLPRVLHAHNWRRHLSMNGGRQIMGCLLSGRPLLIVTGHFGNWEMAGFALGLLGFTTHAVARPLDNPYLDDFFRRFREKTGQKLLAKKGDFDEMEALLKKAGVLATLADQDAGPRGLFVDFFGRPASTHKAIALLALEHRVPLMVVGTPKVAEPMRYEVVAGEEIRPEEYDRHPDAVRAMTQRMTTALERLIRKTPEQYLWLHRRWKHMPPAKKMKKLSPSLAAASPKNEGRGFR